MMKTGTRFLVLLMLFIPCSLFAYTVHPTHPRIFLTSDDLPKLRARCGIEDGDNRTKHAADWGTHKLEFLELNENRGDHVLANAFLYLMTSDDKYAKTAIENMAAAEEQDLPVAFDWVYDALSEDQKQTVGSMIIEKADPQLIYNYGVTNGTAQNDGWHWRILPWAGLALYNEGINDEKAEAYLDRARYWFYEADNATLSNWAYIGNDGSGYKGNYDWYGLQGPLDVGVAWDIGTDESLLADFDRLKNAGWWYLFILRPGGGQWERFQGFPNGDGFMIFYRPMRTLLYRCASLHRDPRAQKFGDLMSEAGGNYVPYQKHKFWKDILWHDKTVPAVDLGTLPKARFFDTLGRIVMRTGWDLEKSGKNKDIWADFRCEKYAQEHAHYQQNHFTISRGLDQLALDSGGYDNFPGDHRKKYYHLALAHNTMLIGGDQRDMGEVPRGLTDLKSEKYNRGFIERYGHDPDGYTYGLGDATKAYPASRVSNFTRQFVFINEKYFVVFDRVSAVDPSLEKVWLLHTVNEPAIADEGQWQEAEFGFTTGKEGGKKSSTDTHALSATTGNSRLYLSILQPEEVLVSKLGGSNAAGDYNLPDSYEFWNNGTNYPADDLHYETTPDMGHWRIEVRPRTEAGDHVFLNVLQPCGRSDARVETVLVRGNTGVENREMLGVHIRDKKEPCVVLFALRETAGGNWLQSANFTVDDPGQLRILVCDLVPGAYYLYRNGVEIEDSPRTVASGENTLYFRVFGGGDFMVTMVKPDGEGT